MAILWEVLSLKANISKTIKDILKPWYRGKYSVKIWGQSDENCRRRYIFRDWKQVFLETPSNENCRNHGFSPLKSKIFKIRTYKYHQNDRLNKTYPLHLISLMWVPKFRSYGQKTKILKIATIWKMAW